MGKPLDNVWCGLMVVVVLAAALYGAWVLAGRDPDGRRNNFFLEGLRTQRLEEDRMQFERCLEAEHAVIDLTLRGQLSLTEAADALHDADEMRPESLRRNLEDVLHLPADEIFLRLVLLRAESEHGHYPNRRAVVKRLQAEYEALRGYPPPLPDGILSLPETAPVASRAVIR